MPDAPDGYRYRIESPRHVLGDMAELAVRLGSVVGYHRSGTVLFADGMENGTAPYLVQTDGLGASVIPVTSPTFQGGLSLKCTGGSHLTGTAGILKRIQPIILGKVGLETTFSLDTDNEAYTIRIQLNDGTNRIVYGIRHDSVNNDLLYRTATAIWTKIQNLELEGGDEYLFHIAKLVVDLVAGKFVKLYIDQTTIDLSSLIPWTSSDSTKPRLEFLTIINSRSGNNDIVYIDNMIITTDEP